MSENIVSKKNKSKFLHNGYLYVFEICSKGDLLLLFWRCELKNKCKGCIHTINYEVLKEVNGHSHATSPVSVEVATIKINVKCKAEEVSSSIMNICIENNSQATQATLSNSEVMEKCCKINIHFTYLILVIL